MCGLLQCSSHTKSNISNLVSVSGLVSIMSSIVISIIIASVWIKDNP